MRKICFSVFVLSTILLMVGLSFAQTPRDGTSSEAKTSFTNIAVRGLNQDGTSALNDMGLPGYIEMTSTSGSVFYLYIGTDGVLRIASDTEVGFKASPSIVGWGDGSGVVVGTQL